MNQILFSPRRILVTVGFLVFCQVASAQNGVLREVFTGIGGDTLADLTSSPNFPSNPTTVTVETDFEAPTDVDDSYGQRLTAYVIAPATGNYTFWIASDDNSSLRLSTDTTSANMREIASVPTWTSPREWTKFASQTSSLIRLTNGQKYYIEALMKEGSGGDNLAVGWQLPNGTYERPIPNARLQVYGMGPPQITVQPASVTTSEGGAAQFSVQLQRAFGATYQWIRGSTNIPGATNSTYTLWPVSMADNGATFKCAITNSQGKATSSTATLTVQPDSTAPTLTSVSYLGDSTIVTVLFSEAIQQASGIVSQNYSIDQGVTVSGASFGADPNTIVLRTSPLSPGVTYTLTVNNVKDRATNPNAIAPNSKITFTINVSPIDISNLSLNREPIGPSSRRTGLVFSEIMYHPTNRPDGKILEFIELFNSQVYPVDLTGFRISGDVDYAFPANTVIQPGTYVAIAPVPADIQQVYGISGVLGGFTNRLADGTLVTNRLSNGSGTIRLRNRFGAVLLEASYSGDSPWPLSADGAGHSLVLARPTYGEGNPQAWEASDLAGGTPGRAESAAANPYQTIVINEFLAHTDLPDVDYIELYNYGSKAVNLNGCTLSDRPDTNRFVITNVTIPAMGYAVFTETQMGFALSAAGETIYFKNPAGTKIIDAVQFKGQENGVSTGRYPDGAPGFYRLQTKTPGTANTPARVSQVVLNELMYNPPVGGGDDEFVELYNRGTSAVNLGGWKLSDAVSFTFPSNAVIPAGGYVVVANKAAHLMTNYANLNANNTFGNYGGTLANGARLALTMPDQITVTNGSTVSTNTIHIAVDEVTYGKGGRWGEWANGGGSSLELIDSHSNHRLPSNWTDSNEETKSGWTNIEFTGTIDNGSITPDAVHVFLQGPGECLVDDVAVMLDGVNVVANPDFNNGLSGWFVQGTQDQSYWQSTGGYNGSGCLHIVSSGRGDTGANRVRGNLNTAPYGSATVTLRAKVRWLKGNPEILIRLKGNWLEAYGNALGARNLGTPGARNSRAVANAGPAIHDVVHSPILPAENQAVTVRAQVNDPDGLSALVLKYRIDPSTNYASVSMNYVGAGTYVATIPGQAAGTMVAFAIQATDNATQPVTTLFPSDAPDRECLVRFGETDPNTGRIGTYHLWFTQKTNNRWSTREHNSNEPLDASFVYGNSRVVYNIGTLYSGSPWHTPGYNGPMNNICDYVLVFPDDDLMLGTTDFVLASLGNLNNDGTTQREKMAFWVLGELGCPNLYRRDINLFVNGLQRGLVYEDAQQPGSETVKEWFPTDSNGDLHKIEDWFEFDNSGDTQASQADATLGVFTTTGGAKKLARYRWNWRKRAVKDSANEYSSFFKLVDAMNRTQPDPYNAEMSRQVNFEEWARVMALEHTVGNWDSYGYNRGKNMFAYKPANGKWTLLAWDIDFVWDNGGDSPQTDLNPNSMSMGDQVARNFLTFPPVQRAYYRALQDMINGPLADAKFSAEMINRYQGLTSAGLSVEYPSGTIAYASSRRAYIQSLLSTVAATFTVNPISATTNRNYVTLTGTAPIAVSSIQVNGVSFPVTWTGVKTWKLTLALQSGSNKLAITGYDPSGNPVANSSANLTISYTGTAELPQNRLVINEIMYNPALPDAGYIELFNTSSTTAFDLSGFELHGADFTFPGGSIIAANGYSVIAAKKDGFVAAYGATIPLAGSYEGTLKNSGETIQLVKPGTNSVGDVIIDEVTYDTVAPWPTRANGFGPSLQLIDPLQDNNRVANWAVATTNIPPTPKPQWQYVTYTGTASASRLYVYLNVAGDLYVDDMKIVAGAVPETGDNYLQNGDFESPLSTGWQTTANVANSSVSTTVAHSGSSSLHLVCNAAGSSAGDSLLQDMSLVSGAQYTLSFWYLQTTNAETLTIRLSGSGIRVDQNVQLQSGGGTVVIQQPATPGAANSVSAILDPIPLVWLNELQPNNVSGVKDNAGDRDPWVEIYNSSTNILDLTGYYLSGDYSNMTKWAFPSGTKLNPGQFRVVWLDNEPGETSGTNLHANFRASSTNGSVVLVQVAVSKTNVIDYLNYDPINNDRSYGAYPDGTPTRRHIFYYATPGAANDNSWPLTPVLINEWMASNTRTIPNHGKYSDWFELYNAGPTNADLTGYYLGNTLTNRTQFKIPAGYPVPARGFLLVWADGNSDDNNTNDPALHVDFKLGASGEAIALFTPQGVLIDGVTFGQQTNDISQGRWPDGNSGDYYFMPTPTPGMPNMLGVLTNSAPFLPAIPDQTVYQESTLSFAAVATDPDPGQILTYSLDDGAPLSASINPVSGVFTWTPTQADPPADYTVTIRVTDNGFPQQSVTTKVKITVLEQTPLRMNPPKLDSNGNFTITWPTQPGKVYRISYKLDLNDTQWTTLTELNGTGADLSVTDEVLAAKHRYFQIELLNP